MQCVLGCFFLAAKLVIESDNFGRVRIRGALTNYYLCIKRNATLIGRKVALIAYGHFIILCAQCLQNAAYSLLIGRIKCMGIWQIFIESALGEKGHSRKSFVYQKIKMLYFKSVFLPRWFLNEETLLSTHSNEKELPSRQDVQMFGYDWHIVNITHAWENSL